MRLDYAHVTSRDAAEVSKPSTGDADAKQSTTGAHLLMEQGFASAMSVLIGSDEGPRGILSVHSVRVRYFDDQQVSFLQSAANVLAAAMNQLETEQELRVSEERLRLAMEAAALGIWDCDLKTDQITWSRSLALLFGLSAEMTSGTYADLRALIHPDDVLRVDQSLERARLERTPFTHEYRIQKSDGVHWITGRGKFFYGDSGEAYRAMGVAMDVSERRRAEEQSRLRDRALEAVSQGIVITDAGQPDNPIIYVNQGFERVTGYSREEALGRNCRFLQGPATDPAAVAEIRDAIAAQATSYCELLNYRKDGSTFWNALAISPVANAAGRVTHYLGMIVDVSERRRLEDQYRHAQKMEAVGRFAGGVAHDFNNLLTVINGCGDLLLQTIGPEENARDLVEQIRQAGERGANLTRQILAFSRHQVVTPRTLDVNAVIRNMESMLRRLIGEDLEFQTELDPAIGLVKADPGHIEQVIVNLVINARDAMPKGGTLTVRTHSRELASADLEGRPDAKLGAYVMLAVSDTGAGMNEATLARIFEPFFTTKGARGTGLGLATVYGIVHQAHGFIEVVSAPGQGAAFHVYLPCILEAASIRLASAGSDRAIRGNQTVLLVEDEAGVRKLVRNMLEGLGLQVLEASCGHEAIELGERYADVIHLLLTDVVMPRMSGRELADRLQASRPETKVLYMSGYVDDAVVLHGVFHAETVFLQKPFDAANLAERIRESLARN
jgi:PAS domain S-box-containing protein